MEHKRTIIIIGSIVAALLAGFLLMRAMGNNTEPTDTPDGTAQNEETPDDVSAPDGGTTPDDNPNTEGDTADLPQLEAPTLQKSSGNNGPVPAGALINFTCSGPSGADCQIILTDNNSSAVEKLPKKALKSGDRSGPTTTWTWNSKKGNWSVMATVSADNYASNSSAAQELVVE